MATNPEFGQRRYRTSPPPRPTGGGKLSMALSIALAVTALAALAWTVLPPPAQWTFALFKAGDGLDFSGVRHGRSATAPVLKFCLTKDVMNVRPEIDISPDMLLTDLKASASQGRVTRVVGAPREHAVLELAQMWGQVADCVYNQNAFRLCDIDNRTLAVEAGGIFVRQAERIIAKPEMTYAAQPGEIHALTMTRDRILDLLRNRIASGVLIAADFPDSFAPPPLRAVLDGTATVRNECAKEKQP